ARSFPQPRRRCKGRNGPRANSPGHLVRVSSALWLGNLEKHITQTAQETRRAQRAAAHSCAHSEPPWNRRVPGDVELKFDPAYPGLAGVTAGNVGYPESNGRTLPVRCLTRLAASPPRPRSPTENPLRPPRLSVNSARQG